MQRFYVRYHLELIPNAVDLSTWRLSLEGNVERPLQLGFDELVKNFKAVSVAAVTTLPRRARNRRRPAADLLPRCTGAITGPRSNHTS